MKTGAFQGGYQYAKDQLAKGTSVEELEVKADGALDYTDFDRGVVQALFDYENGGLK